MRESANVLSQNTATTPLLSKVNQWEEIKSKLGGSMDKYGLGTRIQFSMSQPFEDFQTKEKKLQTTRNGKKKGKGKNQRTQQERTEAAQNRRIHSLGPQFKPREIYQAHSLQRNLCQLPIGMLRSFGFAKVCKSNRSLFLSFSFSLFLSFFVSLSFSRILVIKNMTQTSCA